MEGFMSRITDYNTLAKSIINFEYCVKFNDAQQGFHSDYISFSDSGSWLRDLEYYKQEVYTIATTTMCCMNWHEDEIGTGRIAKSVQNAVNHDKGKNNLIDRHQKTHFNNQFIINHDFPALDRAFYDLYRGTNDRKAFDELTAIFSRKYDLIAFLFFIKNPERYLPIHSKDFEEGFSKLGIQYKMQRRCTWDNYLGFIDIVREIQGALNDLLPMETPATLLDAHSFVWTVLNDFWGWTPDSETAAKIVQKKQAEALYLQEKALSYGSIAPEKRDTKASHYIRNPKVIEYAKSRAKGVCQLCGAPAPFNDKNGMPYLEVHHIRWLSRGGPDTISNAVALCPNCHSKMHIVDNPDDVEYLRKKALGEE